MNYTKMTDVEVMVAWNEAEPFTQESIKAAAEHRRRCETDKNYHKFDSLCYDRWQENGGHITSEEIRTIYHTFHNED